MTRKQLASAALAAVVVCAGIGHWMASVSAQSGDQTRMPAFEVDATWPRLPNSLVPGQVLFEGLVPA